MPKTQKKKSLLEQEALRFLGQGKKLPLQDLGRSGYGRRKAAPKKTIAKKPAQKKKKGGSSKAKSRKSPRKKSSAEKLEEEARRFVEDDAHQEDDGGVKLKRSLTAFTWDRSGDRPSRMADDIDTDDEEKESSSSSSSSSSSTKSKKAKKSGAEEADVTFRSNEKVTVTRRGSVVKFKENTWMTTARTNEAFSEGRYELTLKINQKSKCCMTVGAVKDTVKDSTLTSGALYSHGVGFRTYAGEKGELWNNGVASSGFGKKWENGDTITIELNFEDGQIVFSQNGEKVGGDDIDDGTYYFAVCSDKGGQLTIE